MQTEPTNKKQNENNGLKMKTVFIKPRFNGIPLHRLYYEIMKNPPKGYNFFELFE